MSEEEIQDPAKAMSDSMKANKLLEATKQIDKKEVHVGRDEFNAMKKAKYDQTAKVETSYVIQNKKTKAIVEIRAVSPMMAAKTVGWRPRHVRVLQGNKVDQ